MGQSQCPAPRPAPTHPASAGNRSATVPAERSYTSMGQGAPGPVLEGPPHPPQTAASSRVDDGRSFAVTLPYQKLSLSPNCITRIAARSDRISPTRGASGVMELSDTNPRLFGWPKYGVFVRLNDSPRNCTVTRSVIAKFLNNEKSRFRCPGD